eukprot:GDKH01006789.1.p2 GENE.GDKH01006789.1~~GDKH01006789.1.p2  ORF type:complete len:57 (-),score=9.85 GDKH01006789.1:506-676(-)
MGSCPARYELVDGECHRIRPAVVEPLAMELKAETTTTTEAPAGSTTTTSALPESDE